MRCIAGISAAATTVKSQHVHVYSATYITAQTHVTTTPEVVNQQQTTTQWPVVQFEHQSCLDSWQAEDTASWQDLDRPEHRAALFELYPCHRRCTLSRPQTPQHVHCGNSGAKTAAASHHLTTAHKYKCQSSSFVSCNRTKVEMPERIWMEQSLRNVLCTLLCISNVFQQNNGVIYTIDK